MERTKCDFGSQLRLRDPPVWEGEAPAEPPERAEFQVARQEPRPPVEEASVSKSMTMTMGTIIDEHETEEKEFGLPLRSGGRSCRP